MGSRHDELAVMAHGEGPDLTMMSIEFLNVLEL